MEFLSNAVNWCMFWWVVHLQLWFSAVVFCFVVGAVFVMLGGLLSIIKGE